RVSPTVIESFVTLFPAVGPNEACRGAIIFPEGKSMNSRSSLHGYGSSIRFAFTIATFTALLLTAIGQSQAQTGYDATGAQTTVPSTSPSNRPLRPQRHVARGAARGAALGAVGGAITGDASKGAAAGAAMGGLAGGMRRRDQRLRQGQQQQY